MQSLIRIKSKIRRKYHQLDHCFLTAFGEANIRNIFILDDIIYSVKLLY